MSSTVDEVQELRPLSGEVRSPIPAAAGVAICFLLAVGQVAFAGYRLGGGNQAIQIAFLKHWADPALFANDDMLRQTMPLYPTYFFRLLAPLVNVSGLAPLYLMLQLATSFFTLSAVYLLARSIFKSHAAALVAAALLVAGHHQALANDPLYTAWFTHTLFALPVAIVSLALAYRGGQGRMIAAFAIAGFLFNIHALTAAYVMLMLGLALFADLGEMPRKKWLIRLGLCAAAGAIIAAPTLLQMFAQRNAPGQIFDADWVKLMRVRSADHSFPSAWWAAPNPDIPRYALIFALFVLSWSFSPVRRADTARALRVTVLMTLAVGILFAAGYVFTEIWPVPLVIRLQPFRASRLLLVLMLVHVAYGAVEGIRTGVKGKALLSAGGSADLSMAARIMEVTAGVMVLLTLGLPTLIPLLPWAVLLVLAAALVSGRLSVGQALVAVASLVVAALAYRQIEFGIPLLSANVSLLPPKFAFDALMVAMLGGALAVAILAGIIRKPWGRAIVLTTGLALATCGSWQLFATELVPPDSGPRAAFASAARWAQTQTPKSAIFLTPKGLGDFRIDAQRGLVADWRDGTQLYFSAAFGPDWLSRIAAVEPGLLLSPDGSRLVSRGRSIETLDDAELLALAKKYDASYILLPTPPIAHPRSLETAYSDGQFTAYWPKFSPSLAKVPQGVINPAQWAEMEKFMATTVAQNIEKYRKANVTLQIVDPEGRPVQDLPVTLNQTSHAFYFGCSMSFFEPNDTNPMGDEKAPPMTAKELEILPEIFNASMPGFTGKWMYIEPKEGERHYEDLDKYMDYCDKNHIAVEYHYLTGLLPAFLRGNNDDKAGQMLPAHAREIVERYKDKVTFWQVENDGYLFNYTPPVFKELRAKYPWMKLGISDCVKFYSERNDPQFIENNMYKGFYTRGLLYLKANGVQPDFFSIHGHQPFGLWADPRTMYQVFDKIAAEGVKLHVSEALFPLNQPIIGPVRRGPWTEELQADYVERFLTVCFSHPAMEMVNFWGLAAHGWGQSGGLLNEKDEPRPALERLKKLLFETWHTKVDATLPLDGVIAARAFHGNYHLSVKLPDGRDVQADLTLPQKPAADFKFCLDPQAGTLTQIGGPALEPAPLPARPSPATEPATEPAIAPIAPATAPATAPHS